MQITERPAEIVQLLCSQGEYSARSSFCDPTVDAHLSGRFTFEAVTDGQVWEVVFWRRMLGRTWVRIGARTWDAKVGEFDLHVANLVSKSLHDRDQGVELLSRGVKLLLDVPKACVEHAGTLVWELGGWRALWGTRGLGQG